MGKYEKNRKHPPISFAFFPGHTGHKRRLEYGVKVTGVTVHLVDEKMDHGPIKSKEVRICDEDTLESLEEKIHAIEHDLYWQTLKNLFTGRFK